MDKKSAQRSDLAKRSWLASQRILAIAGGKNPHAAILLGTSDLTLSYCREFASSLEAVGIEFEILDLSAVRRHFGLSPSQWLALASSWGAAVSFEHGKWPARGPEIRLPHGVRFNRREIAPQHLFNPDGSQRYAAMASSSMRSIEYVHRNFPQIDPTHIHLIGDLRADRLLSRLQPPNPKKIGIFSGWRTESLLVSYGERAIDTIFSIMSDTGTDQAVLTYHPRLANRPGFNAIIQQISALKGVSILSGNGWVDEFADCSAFIGDAHTSVFDVISCTGRPIFGQVKKGSAEVGLLVTGSGHPNVDWEIGSAARDSARLVQSVMSGDGL
jgi:hypothetical protein